MKLALPNVLAPVTEQVLNAAVHVGLIPSQVNNGMVTAVFREGQWLRLDLGFCLITGSTWQCLLNLWGAHNMVLRKLLRQVLQRLGVHS